MNKQRKVLITITYNKMGIIIDTKAEEVTQPNLQPTCNQLETDTISRQDAIEQVCTMLKECFNTGEEELDAIAVTISELPSAQPEIIHCRECKWHNGEINQCNIQICASMRGEDFCSMAERRNDEID